MGWLHAVPSDLLKSDVPFYRLTLTAKIWGRDTHGLFDYENKELIEKKIDINGNVFVFGDKEYLFSRAPNNEIIFNSLHKILAVAYKNGRYWVYHWKDFNTEEALQFPADQAWIPLRFANQSALK